MNNPIPRIKQHFQENKKTYYACGLTAVGTAVVVIVGLKREEIVAMKQVNVGLTWKPVQAMEVHIEALGDPGNIIQDNATGTVYASQRQAARALGIHPVRISDHLNGRTPDVNGHTFTKLGKAMVSEGA